MSACAHTKSEYFRKSKKKKKGESFWYTSTYFRLTCARLLRENQKIYELLFFCAICVLLPLIILATYIIFSSYSTKQ